MDKTIDFRSGFDLFCKLVESGVNSLNIKIIAYLIDLSLYKNHSSALTWLEEHRVNTLGYGCENCVNGDPFKYFKVVFNSDHEHIKLIESWLGLPSNHKLSIEPPFVACKEKYVINLPIGFRNKLSSGYNEGVFDVIYDHSHSHKCVVMNTSDNKKLLLMSVADNSSLKLLDLCKSARYLQEHIVKLLMKNKESQVRIHLYVKDFSIGEKFVSVDDVSVVLDKWIIGKIPQAQNIIDQTDTLVAKTSIEVPAQPMLPLPSNDTEVRFTKDTLLAVFDSEQLKPEVFVLISAR